MTEPASEITITLPATEAVHRHIEGLQAALTKRNVQIERLTEQLAEASAGEPNQKALAMAYKRGWQAAAQELMNTTQEATLGLRKVHKDAWEIYLQSEKRDFDGHQ